MKHFVIYVVLFLGPHARASILEEFSSQMEWIQKLNVQTCEAKLMQYQRAISAVDFDRESNEALKARSAQLRELIWQMRIKLHEQLEVLPPKCILEARDIFHQLRDADDFLIEFSSPHAEVDPSDLKFEEQPIPIYDVEFYPGMKVVGVHEKKFEFQDGDLMIARGFSYFSALISQISENKDHFSHSIIVSRKEGHIQTTESYVGMGSKNFEIEYALKNENVRLSVFRPKDSAMGARAASAALEVGAKRLPYDYQMNFEDDRQMSCVEIPVYSYKKASDGEMKIPLLPSRLEVKSTEFLKQIGLKNGELITPDDFETDPRFRLILDWQDARLIRDSRHKDAIVDQILHWINHLNYQLYNTPQAYFAMDVLLPLRQTPLWSIVSKILPLPSIDAQIPKMTLGAMAVLDSVGTKIQHALKEQDDEFKKKRGRPMTNAQLRIAVEEIRREDLTKYQAGENSLFHQYLHPATQSVQSTF